MRIVSLVFGLVTATVVCGIPKSVLAQWNISTNTPASGGSITRFGVTTGTGPAPNTTDTATYSFEQQPNYPNGNWTVRHSSIVRGVDINGMGMIYWSQTLQAPENDLGNREWPVSKMIPNSMPPNRYPDYRVRLFEAGVVDVAHATITVNFN